MALFFRERDGLADRIATLGGMVHGQLWGTCTISNRMCKALRGKTSATSALSVGQTPTMRAVDVEGDVFMCGTGLGALLSFPATAVVKLTYRTPSCGLVCHSAASVPIHSALRACG